MLPNKVTHKLNTQKSDTMKQAVNRCVRTRFHPGTTSHTFDAKETKKNNKYAD